MRIGVPRETLEGERRVALVPDAVSRLVKSGVEVVVEHGAGLSAFSILIGLGCRKSPDLSGPSMRRGGFTGRGWDICGLRRLRFSRDLPLLLRRLRFQ